MPRLRSIYKCNQYDIYACTNMLKSVVMEMDDMYLVIAMNDKKPVPGLNKDTKTRLQLAPPPASGPYTRALWVS